MGFIGVLKYNHECKTPLINGVFSSLRKGTVWQCDECKARWVVSGYYGWWRRYDEHKHGPIV